MGGSGSGKTTLGRLLTGLEDPTSGEILFDGRGLHTLKKEGLQEFRRKVQMVFQNPESSLNPKKTVGQSLREMLRLMRTPKDTWEKTIKSLIDGVGLHPELLSRYPYQLSGGQNQRIVLARVLLLEPEIIILDEPTSALDISAKAQILQVLKRIQAERQLTYVFISHESETIDFVADRIGIIDDGLLSFPGPGADETIS
jgi:ABC-type glutathione transport system ATPase component